MLSFLRLIRWKNLLIIALTMFLMHYVLIYGLIRHHTIEYYSFILKDWKVVNFDFELQLNNFSFVILVLSVVFIAAGGNIINDIFDKNIDALNKKLRNRVGKDISVDTAHFLYFLFTFLGIAGSVWISYGIGVWQLSFIFLIIAGILYFYSSEYQSVPVLGNVIVAFSVALVPFLVPIYDVLALNKVYKPTLLNYEINFNFLFLWVAGFSVFAFLSNLIREIIKDTEDFEGDKAMGQNTIPIKFGVQTTKYIIIALIAVLVLAVLWINFIYYPNHLLVKYVFSESDLWWQQIAPSKISFVYSFLFIIFPSIFVGYKIFKATGERDFALAGNVVKLIMLLGVAYSLVLAYSFLHFQILVK